MSKTIEDVFDGLEAIKERNQGIISQANEATGKTDTTVTSAVNSLIEGFGQSDALKGLIERSATSLIDETAEEVGAYAFYKYAGLQEVTLPNVTTVGAYAFSECPNLETVHFGDKLVDLIGGTFYNATVLNNVILPEGLVHIGASSFGGCSSLTNISLPDSIKNVGGYAFNGSKIILFKLPESLETVGEVAFYNNAYLTFSHIPSGVKTIGNRAFDYCQGITELIFDGVPESIGANAFRSCTNLKTVTFKGTIGENGLSMDVSTFAGCTNLHTINVPWTQSTNVGGAPPWGAPNVQYINWGYVEEGEE